MGEEEQAQEETMGGARVDPVWLDTKERLGHSAGQGLRGA